jgi:hypothetical protein
VARRRRRRLHLPLVDARHWLAAAVLDLHATTVARCFEVLTRPFGQFRLARSDLVSVDTETPTCRATIRDGQLTLNPWSPTLLGDGPEPSAFQTITAALADVTMLDDDELIVVPVPRTPWTSSAEEVVLRWAPAVGWRRVWLPGRVVTFDQPAPLGRALVDCPGCGARWEDESPRFWERVRSRGWFPPRCLACSGSLPEWTVFLTTDDVPVSGVPTEERPLGRG